MGKGSGARPFEVPKEQFNNNWEQTFGKKKEQPTPQPEPKKPQ
jgi:hypothetical protein